MSDSDMDIDDDEVQVQVQPTAAGESRLLARPIEASNSQNDVKKHSDEQLKIINGNLQPNLSGNSGKNPILEGEKGTILPSLRFPAPGQSFPLVNGPEQSKIINGYLQPNLSGSSGKKLMLEGEKDTVLSRFPAPMQTLPPANGPEQKRPAYPCKFFAQGRCTKGNSCRFLHVNENMNRTSQQQVVNNMAGTSGIQSIEERRPLESKEGVRFSMLSTNGVTSLVNPPAGQRVFPFTNEMRFMPSLENMGRGSLQKCGAVFTENRPVFGNSTSSFPLRSSFVQEHGSFITSNRQTDMGSSGPAWTGSVFSSAPLNQYASPFGNFENRNDINESGSLPMEQALSVPSVQDAEVDTTSDKKEVSSNDWEPSEPFRPSFTIPPYILPSSDALYDPFMDIENPEGRSPKAQSSTKGKDAQKKSGQQKDGDSASNDKNSSCSQNQFQETVVRKKLETHGLVEGVATSVVDQNDASATTPSKEISSSAAVENRAVLKRSKPAGHGSWHRSDGSSHQKKLKTDEMDGEVRSDAGTKVMRQFRTAVVETIKDMLKPLWREGRLSKDVHNMIVKRATEKIVSAAVQLHQVPTNNESVEKYLSMSSTRIVKLVEGYVEKFGKPQSKPSGLAPIFLHLHSYPFTNNGRRLELELCRGILCLFGIASEAGEGGNRKKRNSVEGTLSNILTMFLCLRTIQIVSD
ncbi:BnaCnng05170D [Brassica napus]|uniref:BnaCnng05170D protein n=1 Tax=Brassica napus TaxID=3708 RepID=A0A078GS05_BRANA|nr:BnaCnng05170D [Brassica napus]